MPDGYATHDDFLRPVLPRADARQAEVEDAFERAFARALGRREVVTVDLSAVSTSELADILVTYPVLVKPLLVACHMGSRAVARDLRINLDTYRPRLKRERAELLAAYLAPFLTRPVDVPALAFADRSWYVDKEIRAEKARWERAIVEALSLASGVEFKKRKFDVDGDQFELDGATPVTGPIRVGIDVKRVESPRDIHKRGDEIVNKAAKFKRRFPTGRFGVVAYYPFPDGQTAFARRVRSTDIDGLAFATTDERQIAQATRDLLDHLGMPHRS